jgi:hypothetical protein
VAVCVVLLYATAPGTKPPPAATKVNVELEMVLAFMAVLKTALIAEVTETDAAPLAGVVDVTLGAAGVGVGVGVLEPEPPEQPLRAKRAMANRAETGARFIFFLAIP